MAVLKNARHERFAQNLAEGKQSTEAYVAAGFQKSPAAASRLSKSSKVSQRVTELLTQRAARTERVAEKVTEKLALTKEWVVSRLMENAERSLRRVPVLDDDGKPTGEWKYDGTVANRALELLGKHLGILIERREIGEPGEFDRLADLELFETLREDAAHLGLILPDENETAH